MLHGLDLGSDYDAHDMRVAIVVARWNALITDRLAQGAVEALRMAHAPNPYITHAPGAFELPIVAQALACSGRFDAVLALGAVIRGDTAHFEFVAGQCARGLMDAGLKSGIPVMFGVLTVDTLEQALVRTGAQPGDGPDAVWDVHATLRGNKGAECAFSALETISALRAADQGKV